MNLVIPGEKIKSISKKDFNNYKIINCYTKEKNNKIEIYSKFYGILNKEKNLIEVIPINGKYMPNIGDFVIGIIKEVLPNMWILNINSPFSATLLLKDAFNEKIDSDKSDLSKFYDIGDVVLGKIVNITRNKTVRISLKSSPRKKLEGGFLIEINNILNYWILQNREEILNILERRNIELFIGKNRLMWVKGPKDKVIKLLKLIKEIEKTLKLDIDKFKEI
jgi:exosome complex component RRP4